MYIILRSTSYVEVYLYSHLYLYDVCIMIQGIAPPVQIPERVHTHTHTHAQVDSRVERVLRLAHCVALCVAPRTALFVD